jgi:hypothetical protein
MIRYIFSVSTGRAGSHYLSEIFAHVDGCVSAHEPAPVMNGAPMRAFLAGDPRPLERLIPEKLAAIDRARRRGRIYVETNHCFIKGFGWLLLNHLPAREVGVVVLHRDPAQIKASLHRNRCTPLMRKGDRWMITPAARPRLVPLPGGFSHPMLRFYAYRAASRLLASRLVGRVAGGRPVDIPSIHRYADALLDWYLAETRARWEAFQRKHPDVRSIEVDLDQLNTIDGITAMLDAFGLVAKRTIHDVIGRKTNTKSQKRAH